MICEVLHPNGLDDVTLTTYVHEQSPKLPNVTRRPAVLVLPGGGYEHCSDRESEPIAIRLAGVGYHAFVLRYRTAGSATWPNPLTDAEAGLRTIIDNAQQWGVESDRIAVLGCSAGGHLAASLALYGQVKPARLMLLYPVITAGTLQGCQPETHGAPDLLSAVTPDAPPAFMAHSVHDELVPVTDSLSFAETLSAHEVPFELHVLSSGRHGLSLANSITDSDDASMTDPTFATWIDRAIEWLGRELPVG